MFIAPAGQDVRAELEGVMSDFHPGGFRLIATVLAHADTRDLLPNFGVATPLVWGDADARSLLTVAHQIYDAIPGARLAIISGAGHVSNLEERKRFDAEVRNFCPSVSIT